LVVVIPFVSPHKGPALEVCFGCCQQIRSTPDVEYRPNRLYTTVKTVLAKRRCMSYVLRDQLLNAVLARQE
jgi:hypothetical protein